MIRLSVNSVFLYGVPSGFSDVPKTIAILTLFKDSYDTNCKLYKLFLGFFNS